MNKTGVVCPQCKQKTDASPCWNCGYEFRGNGINELEKLQKEALKLIEESSDEEFRKMVFFWHGAEFLASGLIESIEGQGDCGNLQAFIDEFQPKVAPPLEDKTKPEFRKLKRDTVISCANGKELVGVYFADTDGSQALIECSPEKADRIIRAWNEEE